MLLKPVTALALSALVSFASFTASSASAAPNSAEGSETAGAPPAKGVHHPKKAVKKATVKKKAHLAAPHAAEPKESPKVAASLARPLDVKGGSEKNVSTPASSSKKVTLAATGKETMIGGSSSHASAGVSGKAVANDKKETGDKLESSLASSSTAKPGHKVALGPLHASAGKSSAMSKSGRAPARHESAAAKAVDDGAASDDHPTLVALRSDGKASLDGAVHVDGKAPVLAKLAKASPPPPPCMHEPIEFVRGAEQERFSVTRCDGSGAPLADERLSVLARPETAARPASIADIAKVKGPQLAPGVRRLDTGLLERVQLIADHFATPGMPERISIVSGYRPGSVGSFPASAQALDFHLEGVPNEALVDFCKTLENTGCGYYPNSSFVHVDVRQPGTGHVAWIDASGPGEPPHYVASWPPPPDPDVKIAAVEMGKPEAEPEALPVLPTLEERGRDHGRSDLDAPAAATAPLNLRDWE